MKTYNIMVYFTGEGTTNIYLPKKGDTLIYNGRPVYIKNADFKVLEALRSYRGLGIDIKIGVSDKGAFKVIDYNNTLNIPRLQQRNDNVVSSVDINSILKSGQSGPIILDDKETVDTPVENSKNPGDYVLPSGSHEGETISQVYKAGVLKSVYSGFKSRNPEVKAAIEDFYKTITK